MKKFSYKKFIFILIGIGLIITVERLCHRATDGFALVNIYAPKGTYEGSSPAISSEERNQIKSILNQPYSYLDSGAQSYVFISQDKNYVLKLFKFQHMRIPPWLNYLPLPKTLSHYRERKKEKKKSVVKSTFISCKIAYDHLKADTGLILVHLDKTKLLNQRVSLIDKIGVKHEVELDNVEFILQKAASLAYDTIDQWMGNGELEKARAGVSKMLDLAFKRCLQGLGDRDPDFQTNFGFLGEEALQIDIGRFSYDESCKDPEIYRKEMIRITRAFKGWIETNHPRLLPSFQSHLTCLIGETSNAE